MNRLVDRMSWPQICKKIASTVGQPENRAFIRWLRSKEDLGVLFDPYLYARCFRIVQDLQSDLDHVTVVSGAEGTGKTTIGSQISSVVSPTFHLRNICYDPERFYQQLQEVKSGDTIQIDEGALFLFSRDAMRATNRDVIKLFTIIRDMNIHTLICIPKFSSIDTYIREHRAKTMIRVTARGKYTGYNRAGIIQHLEIEQRRKGRLRAGQYWRGYFTKEIPRINDITLEAYRRQKAEMRRAFLGDLISRDGTLHDQPEFITIHEAQKIMPMHRATYMQHINRGILQGKKIGRKWFIDSRQLKEIPPK